MAGCDFYRFALFEADRSDIPARYKPQVTSLRSSPGANLIGPLRGPYQSGNWKNLNIFAEVP
jgi:hypothetical protein